MTKPKPKSMTTEEFIKTATMFYLDAEHEKEFADEVQSHVNALTSKLQHINTLSELKKYIREDKDSLDNIISLLNISSEKFKRVITMLRLQKGHMPTGEWSLLATRKQMIEKTEFMDEVCELLMNGANLPKYKELVPKFYLENFFIDVNTIARLAAPDDAKRLVKKGLDGWYNNAIGDKFFNHISDMIAKECAKSGLTFTVKKKIPLIGRAASMSIPDENNPQVIIDASYSITTSSTQSTYAEKAEKTREKLRQANEKRTGKKIILINVLDGAGWVARQSDLKKVQRCSDYLFNLKKLNTISEIINYHL